ncbi:DNA-binding MarR family transcriptional regulator [Micromonospora vinacea]|uniref:DNA-binding MarR family transcriptional regulator n=1 Tax=Micromonospora vinacea TaxID=709878 RepID=A0ABS0K7X0_9ACTN|nr:MarR family transcriptional regulator [Micromonospora vinacea]MBG6104717.1 DNA-binding MarR family transcriptional regulator [Micromonospora vinacea]
MEANIPATASFSGAGSVTLAQVFSDLVRCETRLYNTVNETLRRKHGIVASQFEFLIYLRDHPGSRVADLAEFFAIGVGATSKGVGRLEARAWVRRVPNPADGRSLLLELTPQGAELVSAAEGTFQEHLATHIGRSIAPAQVVELGQTLALLRATLEHGAVGTPVG